MAKRRRVMDGDSDDHHHNDLAADYFEHLSDMSSAPSVGVDKKRRKTRRKAETIASEERLYRPAGTLSDAFAHPGSWHTVQAPEDIRISLLRWYANVHESRGMPWRKPYNPLQSTEERGQRAYEVWVSEIMLQQTQVATVMPYYKRWMEKFPTIYDLAAANIDSVNALWKGLGYYSRASRLLSGAQMVVKKYQGRLPDNARDLEAKIPGIGRYTAGAVSSIANGEPVPVLDGNVHRLLSRFLALHAPPKGKATLDILWAAATVMVQRKDTSERTQRSSCDSVPLEITQYPGDINQALIELGSTICKARTPLCSTCPLRPWCRAYEVSKSDYKQMPDLEDVCLLCEPLQERGVHAYPMRTNKKKPREELDLVNVIEWRSMAPTSERWFLLVRRPDRGLLAGLFEFPTSNNVANTTSCITETKALELLLSQLLIPSFLPYDTKRNSDGRGDELRISLIAPAEDVVHEFSHIKKTYRPRRIIMEGGETLPELRNRNTQTPILPQQSSFGSGDDSLASLRPIDAMWVPLKDVLSINMGKGSIKVWNSTKKLWEIDTSGE